MLKNRLHLASPHMSGLEMQYINEAFATNWVAPLGKNVTEFEKEICSYVGAKHAVALSSGTAAIHLGLKALGVGSGDIVFCSSYTFAASCNPINYLGAKPVFIDSEYDSFNMSPIALQKAYSKYNNPKAIIVVNLYGNSANFDALKKIIAHYNTPILEDAAESLGATFNGKQTGTFGDIGIFSFNGNKIITTSGGGMAITDNKEWRDKMLYWATQAREAAPWYEHTDIGYNYRLSNICAGIGRGQLQVLNNRVERKKEIYNLYKKEFSANSLISMCPIPKNCKPTHWLSVISLDKKCKVSFMNIVNKLDSLNIEARPTWKPMHMQPVFKNAPFFSHLESSSVCENLFNRSLCLPSDTKMTNDDIKFIARTINEMTIG